MAEYSNPDLYRIRLEYHLIPLFPFRLAACQSDRQRLLPHDVINPRKTINALYPHYSPVFYIAFP